MNKDRFSGSSRSQIELVKSELETDQIIANLDPLKADGFFHHTLPHANRHSNITLLTTSCSDLLPNEESIKHMTVHEAQAAIRDLGMLTSSIARHGSNPFELPNLEKILILLSRKTDESPRDTVFSYGPRNPQGKRMRTFTELPEEILFIDSFRFGMSELIPAVVSLEHARNISPRDPKFVASINDASHRFSRMTEAMLSVQHEISPETFTSELRPYFPLLQINGENYAGPGGAQMPVILIDSLLWGLSSTDQEYIDYFEDNLRFLPKDLKQYYTSTLSSGVSILERVQQEVDRYPDYNQQPSLDALDNIFISIQKFRYPHKKVADDNMVIRAEGSVGSGQYTSAILKILIEHTSQARKRIHQMRTNR
jgi:hypothetical protein